MNDTAEQGATVIMIFSLF